MKMTVESFVSVANIKEDILSNVGKSILVKEYNKQGKAVRQYRGTITQTYENLFLIKMPTNQFYINKSFAYNDLVMKGTTYEFVNDIM